MLQLLALGLSAFTVSVSAQWNVDPQCNEMFDACWDCPDDAYPTPSISWTWDCWGPQIKCIKLDCVKPGECLAVLYEHPNGEGATQHYSRQMGYPTLHNICHDGQCSAMDNKASSIRIVGEGCMAVVYTGAHYQGRRGEVSRGEGLFNFNSNFDDNISSIVISKWVNRGRRRAEDQSSIEQRMGSLMESDGSSTDDEITFVRAEFDEANHEHNVEETIAIFEQMRNDWEMARLSTDSEVPLEG